MHPFCNAALLKHSISQDAVTNIGRAQHAVENIESTTDRVRSFQSFFSGNFIRHHVFLASFYLVYLGFLQDLAFMK